MTQEKVLDKLAKLVASREGEAALGNSAAAEAFAEAINSMLLRHELSMEDVPLAGAKEEPIIEQFVDLDAYGIKQSRVRIGWQESLARIVAEAHLCKFLVTAGSNSIIMVGTKQHVAVAEYAYGVLAASANRMSKEARDAYWRENRDDADFESGNFRAAWLRGFIGRIADRFKEAKKAEVKAAVNMSSSTALMRLDDQLAKVAKHVGEKYKTKIRSARLGSGCEAGYQAGRTAADKITLGQKGVGTNSRRMIK